MSAPRLQCLHQIRHVSGGLPRPGPCWAHLPECSQVPAMSGFCACFTDADAEVRPQPELHSVRLRARVCLAESCCFHHSPGRTWGSLGPILKASWGQKGAPHRGLARGPSSAENPRVCSFPTHAVPSAGNCLPHWLLPFSAFGSVPECHLCS